MRRSSIPERAFAKGVRFGKTGKIVRVETILIAILFASGAVVLGTAIVLGLMVWWFGHDDRRTVRNRTPRRAGPHEV